MCLCVRTARSIASRLFMSILSQLATEIAAAAAAASSLTQAPDADDAPSESSLSERIPSFRQSTSSTSHAAAANAHDHGDSESHEASACSPCLSSTPQPFLASDMPDGSPPARLAVMPQHEQQQCREQLMRVPGLYDDGGRMFWAHSPVCDSY